MAAKKPEGKKLSKSILEMKFMKRSKEKFCKDKDDEEGRAAFASEVTEDMRSGGNKVIIEASYVPCEGLIVGRLSYHGMNPEIEKLIRREHEPETVKTKEDDMEITDVEMAHRYSTLIGVIGNKFKSKRQKGPAVHPPLRKRTKFMKPEDD